MLTVRQLDVLGELVAAIFEQNSVRVMVAAYLKDSVVHHIA